MDTVDTKDQLIKINPKLALLVDAENVPAQMLEEVYKFVRKEYGEPIVKRAYADWTSANLSSWNAILSQMGFRGIHQAAVVKGKNTSDIALCVDALFLYFEQKIEHFAVMTNDSDFTNLFLCLRERGVRITLLSTNRTCYHLAPSANAVHMFPVSKITQNIDLERAPEEVMRDLHKVVYESTQRLRADANGNTSLSELGSYLSANYPDFSVKDYGFKKLSDYICAFPLLYKVWIKSNTVVAFRCISPPLEQTENSKQTPADETSSIVWTATASKSEAPTPEPETPAPEPEASESKIDTKQQRLATNIKLFLRDHGPKSKKEIMSAFGMKDNIARKVITYLMKSSELQMIGKGNQTKYDIIRFCDEPDDIAS